MAEPKGIFRRILELSAEFPALEPPQIAQLLEMHPNVVRSIMASDAFKDKRAKLIVEKHGDKLLGIRGKIFDTSYAVLEALHTRIMENPGSVSDAMLLKLAEFFTPYAAKRIEEAPLPPGQGGQSINIMIGQESLEGARRRVEERGRTIDLPSSTRPQERTTSIKAIAKKREEV